MTENYKNPELTIHERTIDLLRRMTLQEKVGQVNQHLYGWKSFEKKDSGAVELTDYFKDHVAWGSGLGALYGLFRADPWSKMTETTGILAEDSWKISNEIQHYVITHSRLGIPVLLSEECPHGHQGLQSTSYPTNIGRGNSFNRELIKETAALMAEELAYKGVHLALVSTLDLARDPRWGRTEECFGEDPYLAAEFSKSVISGFQGNLITDASFTKKTVGQIEKQTNNIGVVLKHLIAQGDALGGHNSGAVMIGQREFMDVYYPLVKSTKHAVGVMAAYNDIDGIACHANPALLTDLLRKEIGYQGIVMADGTALDRLVDIYGSKEKAAYQGLKAGVDLSLWDQTYLTIENGVNQNIINETLLDQAVYRVLSTKFLLGLFDHPYVNENKGAYLQTIKMAQEKNLALSEESLTLVKNNDLLPLDNKKETLAVIGPNGNNLYNLLGDYTAPQTDEMKTHTVFNEISQTFAQKEVLFAKGCDIRDENDQEKLLKQAIDVAKKADKLILVLGGSSARNFDMEFLSNGAVSSKGINMDSGENVDLASLTLGGQQSKLFHELYKLEIPIITVLIQGRPHEINEIIDKSEAVLLAWYPGQMGSKAIANTLSGRNNPSGKLSISYPRSSNQLPVYYYQRAIASNPDYYDLPGTPLFEFGYGESYTSFKCSDLKITKREHNDFSVHVKVTNTGDVTGKETILLFLRFLDGDVIQRKKLLRGFEKVTLASNESQTIQFKINADAIRYFDASNKWQSSKKVEIEIANLKQQVIFD